MRILIVSSDSGLEVLVASALEGRVHGGIERVGSPEEAVARQRSAAAGLLLIDARGALAEGRRPLVEAMRGRGGAGATQLLVTAVGDPPPLSLLEAGADDFIALPADPGAVAARLHVALRAAAGAQAVRTLAQNEARFRAMVHRSADFTAVIAVDGRIIYASPSAERVTGLPVGALLGRYAREVVFAEDIERARQHIKRGETGPLRMQLRRAGDDSPVLLEMLLSNLLRDPDVGGIVVNARDVTERERAEAAVRASEESLSATLRSIGEAVIATDDAGRVVRMNPVAERISGWTVGEALGRPISEVAPLSAPGDGAVERLVERVREGALLTGGTALLGQRGGGARPVAATASPIRDGSGRLSGVVLVLRDVTEEQRAALALRRSEQSFRTLIERAPEGITVQRRGHIIYANPTAVQMLGYPGMASLVGMKCIELVHPDDREAVRLTNEEAIRTGIPSPASEQRYLRHDHALVIAETIALPLDFDGASALVHIARDVTGRKQLEARLLVTDRMMSIGTLASGVAHEINNPLASVIANLRFLAEELAELDKLLPDHRRTELLEAVADGQESADRVRVIVRDLKAFSRGDEEKRGPVDVLRVVESTVHLAWNEIRHRARLVRDLEPVPHVVANEARLGQVLLNLVVNAAHAIVEGDAESNVIRVATRRLDGDRILIVVSDTGVGISEEHQRRLFDPFFTTKPIGVGTGLGLFVCHGIITSLGGEIGIESEEGRGTTVRVTLPSLPPAPQPAAPVPVPASKRRGHVLVVDDEPMILVSVRRLLANDHEVLTATSAQEALELLRSGAPVDVVLCDLMMPDMTGMDLFAEIKRERPALTERVIFLSGGAFTQRARAFLDEVDNPRLDKPFEAGALRDLVRAQLGPVPVRHPR